MSELVIIYHPDCNPSNKLLKMVSGIEGISPKIINIYETDIESSVKIEKVPTLIVDNQKMLVGKEVFEYFENMINTVEEEIEEDFGLYGKPPPKVEKDPKGKQSGGIGISM